MAKKPPDQTATRQRTTEELARMTKALIADSLITSQRLNDHVELLREFLQRFGYEEKSQAGDEHTD